MIFTAPRAGAHGGDGHLLARALGVPPERILDLSASLNPVAPDPTPIVARHVDEIRRYPDPSRAHAALAEALQVEPDRLVLTNGGAEAIALVATAFPTGWVAEPEFSLYRRHLAAIDPTGPRWRSNPHNPTGVLAPSSERAEVWDEAFWPLATGSWTRGDADSSGAIVLGSLTKLLSCPGLRIGYTICPDDDIAARLTGLQPRWAVNGLAGAALPDLLATVDLPRWSARIRQLRQDLAAVLNRAGYQPRPSDANWLLVDAPGIRDRLAARGIAARDCTSFGMPGTVRIAVPDPDGLARVEAALCAGAEHPDGEPR